MSCVVRKLKWEEDKCKENKQKMGWYKKSWVRSCIMEWKGRIRTQMFNEPMAGLHCDTGGYIAFDNPNNSGCQGRTKKRGWKNLKRKTNMVREKGNRLVQCNVILKKLIFRPRASIC